MSQRNRRILISGSKIGIATLIWVVLREVFPEHTLLIGVPYTGVMMYYFFVTIFEAFTLH